jgi:DNA-binding HxlR family transcriptional regulator
LKRLGEPWPGEIAALHLLSQNGRTFTELSKTLDISRNGLARILKRLDERDAIHRPNRQKKPYEITLAGRILIRSHLGIYGMQDTYFSPQEFDRRRLSDLQRYCNEIRKLHRRVYQLMMEHEPQGIFTIAVFELKNSKYLGIQLREFTPREERIAQAFHEDGKMIVMKDANSGYTI